MRILRLSAEHVRGIHSIVLQPEGTSLVIWGPNGSGKSAVVDAVDFLLTGEIARLTGKGTGRISLKAHGPHVDSEPSAARVSALVQIPGVADPIEISRCMEQPKDLVYDEVYADQLKPILQAAQQHQHVLSRRELLRFITAEPSSRAEEIQELLSLTSIEKIRTVLVKFRNETTRDRETEERNVATTKAKAASIAGLQEFDPESLLGVVNNSRAVLGAPAVASLDHAALASGVSLPKPAEGTQSINVTALEETFGRLEKLLSDRGAESIAVLDRRLRGLLGSVLRDEMKRQQAARLSLYETGLPLVPESGECPLCEKPWPRGELRRKLEERIASAKTTSSELGEIGDLATSIRKKAENAVAAIERITATLESIKMDDETAGLRGWEVKLSGLIECLKQPLDRYPGEGQEADHVARLLAEDGLVADLASLLKRMTARFPAATPEQAAWSLLTQLEVGLDAVEDRERGLGVAKSTEATANVLHDCFVEARDHVLGELYEAICDRFTELYSELHCGDESRFSALLQPDGAGLRLEVDFYGRGEHPPHALHSEGHQDSMGLCLYLALAEHLVGDVIGLTILDDVVMSVDAEHRRGVCELLRKHFPDRQFLITTHDKTWMNQLRASGIVSRGNVWEFYNWDIDTGPYVSLEPGLWVRIDERLEDGDVNEAAGLLRRGSEQFFSLVCDSLQAPVRFSLEGRHNLGDLLPAAVSRLTKLLKAATVAARSWGKAGEVETLKELRSTIAQVYERTNAERWPINPSVHFAPWENFTKQDFVPVKEAFQDLHGLFVCQKPGCGSIIRVEKQKFVATSIRCKCGDICWNLIAKKNASE